MLTRRVPRSLGRRASSLVTGPGSSDFSFRDLFRKGEVGVAFDISDRRTLFQDSAGTTPVTTPGEPVGLILDKSKGLVLGPELITNGTFDTNTSGWAAGAAGSVVTLSWNAGVIRVENDASGTGTTVGADQAITTVVGRTYRVSGSFRRVSGASANFTAIGLSAGVSTSSTDFIDVSFVFVATATTTTIRLGSTVGAAVGEFDNVSVRELAGNHASQATAASRPIYGVVPKGGRRNLAVHTETFSTGWGNLVAGIAVAPAVTANAGLAPDGTMNATRIVLSLGGGTTTSDHTSRQQLFTYLASTTYTFSVWLKSNTGVNQTALIYNRNSQSSTLTVTPEWQRFSHTIVSDAQLSSAFGIRARGVSTGDVDVLAWGAQLEVAPSQTSYQRVGTAYDVTEAGVPSCHYLQFDGVDDWLSTAAIDFSGTDKMSVFAGARKLGDALAGHILQIGSLSAVGHSELRFPRSNTQSEPLAAFRDGLNAIRAAAGSAIAAPVSRVLAYHYDASSGANGVVLRSNGQVAATTLIVAPFTNPNQSAFIGGGATANRFNGLLFGLIARGALSSASEIQNAEKLLAKKTSEAPLL
jgi:hypothetical protein